MAISMPFSVFILFSLVFFNFSSSYAASDPTYQSFVQCLSQSIPAQNVSDILYSNTNPLYASVLRAYIRDARFNTSSTPKPTIIITPTDESQVSASVACSQKVGFQLKTRSGGHDYEGLSYVSSTPFFVLDMFNLRSISVNIANESAWVQVGATLGELYYNIWEKSNVHGFPAGVCPTVGVGGHLSGAGYGTLIRKYGLSSDHIVDARIVDVNGTILDRKGMGEDLFWAIRGGGAASFGVVLAYKVNLVRVPDKVTVFQVERFLAENATDIAFKWQSIAPKIDNNMYMRMLLQPATRNRTRTVKVTILGMFLKDTDSAVALLENDFPELGLRKENCTEMRWIDSVLWWTNIDVGTSPTVLLDRNIDNADFWERKSDYVEIPIHKNGLELLWKKIIELEHVELACNAYGGRMDEINDTVTPFAHRAGNLYKIQYLVIWDEPGNEAEMKYTNRAKEMHEFMTQFVSKDPRKAYFNYRDIDIGKTENWTYEEGKVYGESYFNRNYERLVDVKTKVDPKNIFRNEQIIPPRSINTTFRGL